MGVLFFWVFYCVSLTVSGGGPPSSFSPTTKLPAGFFFCFLVMKKKRVPPPENPRSNCLPIRVSPSPFSPPRMNSALWGPGYLQTPIPPPPRPASVFVWPKKKTGSPPSRLFCLYWKPPCPTPRLVLGGDCFFVYFFLTGEKKQTGKGDFVFFFNFRPRCSPHPKNWFLDKFRPGSPPGLG